METKYIICTFINEVQKVYTSGSKKSYFFVEIIELALGMIGMLENFNPPIEMAIVCKFEHFEHCQ